MPRVLIVIDPLDSNHTALKRLKELPVEGTVARVECYVSTSVAQIGADFMAVLEDKQTWLEGVVADVRAAGYEVETRVQAFNRLFESIIYSASEFAADYVIKPLRQHSALEKVLYSATDWNLVRFCPVPLLLVRADTEIKGKPVLAAVDTGTRDAPHKSLNSSVISSAKALSELVGGHLEMVTAYHLVTIGGSDPIMRRGGLELVEHKRVMFEEAAAEVAGAAGMSSDDIHVEEGAAELVANDVAENIGAGVLVVGTIARSGIAGLFIGNTAEAVIEGATTDVLVVKHPDFESPIKGAE